MCSPSRAVEVTLAGTGPATSRACTRAAGRGTHRPWARSSPARSRRTPAAPDNGNAARPPTNRRGKDSSGNGPIGPSRLGVRDQHKRPVDVVMDRAALAAGLVRHQPSTSDRRIKLVTLTAEGAATKRALLRTYRTPPARAARRVARRPRAARRPIHPARRHAPVSRGGRWPINYRSYLHRYTRNTLR